MEKDKIIQKIKKLQELVQRGVNGERDNARIILEKLCRQYNIMEEDLDEDKQVEHALVIPEDYNISLLRQIVACRTNGSMTEINVKKIKRAKDRKILDEAYGVKGWNILIKSTEAEFIQVILEYGLYKSALKKDLDALLYAFFDKNRLLVKPSADVPEPEMTRDVKEKLMKAALFSMGMDRTHIRQSIEVK